MVDPSDPTVRVHRPFSGRVPDPDIRLSGDPTTAGPGAPRDLGRYRLHAELGRGGMGARVVAALDLELKRTVALKLLPARFLPQDLVQRFIIEAQATGRLEHPNIVPLYDSGLSPDGELFYTMKLVRGRPLSDLLEEDSTPLPRLLRIFTDVAHAVAFAHAQGVLHRDLKPANVMVGEFGEVLVMDWGLARVAGRPDLAPSAASAAPDARLTQAGDILGTPAYMAPEQARGEAEKVDARTDVFVLGAILYEILAGRPPYQAVGGNEAIRKAAAGEAPPLPPQTPPELAAAVAKAMSLDPAGRYASAAALADDVSAFLDGRTLSALHYSPWQRAAKWARRHKLAATAAALAILALGTGVATTALVSSSHNRGRLERGRREAFDAALGRARAALAAPAATPEDLLAARLAATSELDLALSVRDDPAVRAERLQAGLALFEAALATADYSLARQVARDLEPHGAAPEEIEALRRRADDSRNAVLTRRRERLAAMLDAIRAGLGRPDRPAGAETLEDFVYEAVEYRDEQTVEILGEALAPLVEKGRREGAQASWSDPESDLAKFACDVLGRLGLAGAVRPLAHWMEVVSDEVLAVRCGVALCNTRRPEAMEPLLAAEVRLGINSNAWRQIARLLARVPDPPAGVRATTAREFHARGQVRFQKGDIEGAIADFTEASEREPDWALPYLDRGNARYQLCDFEGALADHTRAIQRLPDDAGLYMNRGRDCAALGDSSGAIADYTRAIELDPNYVDALINRGSVYHDEGNFADAVADYTRALDRDPRNVNALNNRGNSRDSMGDLDGAVADFTRAAEVDPDNPAPFTNRGLALAHRQRWTEALADYDRALERDPRYAPALMNRAITRLNLGQLDAALSDLDRAIEADPRHPDAYYVRGVAKNEKGDLQGAEADMTRAIEMSCRDPEVFKDRGVVRRAAGDLAGAIADWQRFLQLAPRHPAAEAVRRGLDDLLRQAGGDF